MKDGTCPKCDARNVVGELRSIAPGGSDYGVFVGGGITGYRVQAEIRAWICCDCGYTEFYAKNFARIGKAVDKVVQTDPGARDKPIRVSPSKGSSPG
ncbi:MAG: hypothetical protein AB8G99_15065 [Planctomycetaceae bacterium]